MKRKYILTIILFVSLSIFVLPSVVFAQDFDQQTKTFAISAGATEVGAERPLDPRIVVSQIIKLMLGVVGILFFAYSVYAGYLILSSSGDEEKIKKGKSTLKTGVLGLFIAMSAYSILTLVSNAALKATKPAPDGLYYDYDIGTREFDACRAAGGSYESCTRGL